MSNQELLERIEALEKEVAFLKKLFIFKTNRERKKISSKKIKNTIDNKNKM